MANDKETQPLPSRAAVVASTSLKRSLPGKEPPPENGPVQAPEPGSPPSAEALLRQTILERDEARAIAETLTVRLREVEAVAEARQKLARALTGSFQEARREKEALAVKVEAAEKELAKLHAYRDDLEAARRAAERDRLRSEAALVAAHRGRADGETLVRDLQAQIQALHKQIAALGKERDQALLHRADAVKAALATIRKTILEEL